MRDHLSSELGSVPHRRFLVYLMGPYKSVDADESAFDLLLSLRDRLRSEAGVNAFLAVDADVDLDEVDAATQSIAFARTSNVVVFVAPLSGRNLGIGMETGAVLEDVYQSDEDHRRERVVFVHEDGVRSAMIAGVTRRWDATVYSYGDEDELVKRVRQFVANVMNRELTDELPSLG